MWGGPLGSLPAIACFQGIITKSGLCQKSWYDFVIHHASISGIWDTRTRLTGSMYGSKYMPELCEALL